MPAPQGSMLSELTKALFLVSGIQLPMEWSPPGDQFPDAFNLDELVVAPNPPTTLFIQSSLNRYHVDTAKEMSDSFSEYIDGICGAICDGIDKWMKMTYIAGVMINGPIGWLLPGCVTGPSLMPLIFAGAPRETSMKRKYSFAIAAAVGVAWQAWSTTLNGMLSYPLFAAFPGPVAVPTPNIPVPLLTMVSPGEVVLAPSNLKTSMAGLFGDPTALHATALFGAIANAFNTVFQIFKVSTMVQNVLGTGPVPTYAPPFVPVGPVILGTGTGPPGSCIV